MSEAVGVFLRLLDVTVGATWMVVRGTISDCLRDLRSWVFFGEGVARDDDDVVLGLDGFGFGGEDDLSE